MIPQWFRAFQLERQRRQQRRRITRYFECAWQSPWGKRPSRVSSLSPTGCYIEDGSAVPREGDVVPEITIRLATGPVCVEGLVLDAMPGIGFAVRFRNLDPDASARLTAAVEAS